MFSFFRKKEKPSQAATDFASLINRRADDFTAFYGERFGNKLDYQYNSLYLLDLVFQETRISAATIERKQWLAAHAGAYVFRMAAMRVGRYRYLWYHPLDQPMMVVGAPGYRVALLAQQAVQLRLEGAVDTTLRQLYLRFEQALHAARPGDDLLFV